MSRFDMIRGEQEQQGEWILTGLDKAVMPMRLRGTWVFRGDLDETRLKDSLSALLSHYPHLTGRFVDGDKVVFSNEGIPFHVATSTRKISDLAADHTLASEFAILPDKRKAAQGQEAGCIVKMTRLDDGVILSISCLHALMDGNSFYTMAQNWGRAYTGGSFTPPILDQSMVPKIPDWSKEEASARAEKGGFEKISLWQALKRFLPLAWYFISKKTGLRARPIHFDVDLVKAIQAHAIDTSGNPSITQNDALCAHITAHLVSLLGHAEGTRCEQIVVLDARRRIEGLADAFVGNAAFSAPGAQVRVGDSFGAIAAETHETLSPYLQRPSEVLREKMELSLALVHHRLPYLPLDIFGMHAKKPTLFYFNNFSKFGIYETDFGDGQRPNRPVLVIPHDLPDPLMLWPAPPEKGGFELYLTGRMALPVRSPQALSRWTAALSQLVS